MIHTDYVFSTNVKIIIFKYSKRSTYISFYICLAEQFSWTTIQKE